MTATLTFQLPEEAVEHAAAVHGMRYASVLAAVQEALRSKRKYGHDFLTPDEALDWVATILADETLDAITAEGAPQVYR